MWQAFVSKKPAAYWLKDDVDWVPTLQLGKKRFLPWDETTGISSFDFGWLPWEISIIKMNYFKTSIVSA